jgi:hypothetical protein
MNRAEKWVDRLYLPLMGVMSVAVTLLNIRATHTFHTIEKYLVFRERILHGFATTDVMPSYPTPPTFPMWGYGWVLLLTTNKAALLTLQIAVALFSIWYLLRVLDEFNLLNRWSRVFLRVSLVLCLPWYAYHSIEWCHSLAASFFILSVALLIPVAHGKRVSWWRLAVSGVLFGLNLNLASDLYLLPSVLAVACCVSARFSRVTTLQVACWLAVIGLTLVPWMVYTRHATGGTPLTRSTNQGHVLLIGLGQDPQRRFDITYSDGDPMMYQIIRDQLGDDFARRFYASCSFEADGPLRRAFLARIRSQPLDYLNLVQYKLRSLLRGDTGTYTGEFDEGENLGRFGVGAPLRGRVRSLTQAMGHLLQFGTTFFAPFALWAALWRGRPAWALVLLTIAYQYFECSVAVLQPQYVSNLIVPQLLVIAHGAGVAFAFMLRENAC